MTKMKIDHQYLEAIDMEAKRNKLASSNSKKLLIQTYTNTYPELVNLNTSKYWDNLFMGGKKNSGKMYQKKKKVIENYIRLNDRKILSVGFGEGELERKLCNNARSIFGIDNSKYVVEKARKEIPGVFKKASILKIPFSSHAFDVVLLIEVIEHIPPSETFKAFSEIKRVLKKKGRLIISVPINEPLKEMLKLRKNPSGHVRIYTSKLICAELELAGFRILNKNKLYAFDNLYFIKTILQKTFLRNRWKPNNIVIVAEKKC